MYECAQSSITFNNLNLPTYDIHSKQAREQILFNFQTLSDSFINISSKHIQKSKQQNQRINSLKERILRCKDRIQQFQTTNQALIFVSPGEYPKKYKFDPQNNVSIFKEYLKKTKVNKLDMNAHYQVKHQISKLGQQSKLKISQLNHFVVFLVGQLQGKKRTIFQRSLHPSKRQTTLGQIPSSIQYIDSLLLFNSHINPYRKYQITANVVIHQDNDMRKNRKKVQDAGKDQIAIDRGLGDYTKPGFEEHSNRFIPEEKDLEMPDFDMDLELDGIVQYDITTGMGDMPDFDVNNVRKKNVPLDPYANSSNKSIESTSSPSKQTPNNNSNTNILPTPPSLNMIGSSAPNLSILPAPPTLNLSLPSSSVGLSLPIPPSLNLGLPTPPLLNLQLPPAPTLSLSLPAPPSLGNLLPSPPSLSLTPINPPVGGGINALLSQLNNPNPMARLKKTVTLEKGGLNPTVQPPTNDAADKPPRQMTFMEALQAKIKSRFGALHPEKQSDSENQN